MSQGAVLQMGCDPRDSMALEVEITIEGPYPYFQGNRGGAHNLENTSDVREQAQKNG